MRLFAKITDAELMWKSMHELGTTFYRMLSRDEVEILYFSGNRAIHFKGRMSQNGIEKLKALAFPVSRIELNESLGVVKIEQ